MLAKEEEIVDAKEEGTRFLLQLMSFYQQSKVRSLKLIKSFYIQFIVDSSKSGNGNPKGG
ncbi:hypothetical protein QPL79_07715 [Ignisphaera sp. 4213-co]|uniref:Uncharacterized protein n=1 Tax=Ignisphaera cupida TaxID=3050454 RepID=A0ABD4Z7N2_9CREN|nr:hypothetical protein [Ignisphaera sp. 4213-co]MDK6029249.1 hypothetical protein [Ignisphaera sp. 4213-co]